MNALTRILEETLIKTTGLESRKLGPAKDTNFTEEDKKLLISRLEARKGPTNLMMILVIIIHFLLYGVTMFFVFYNRGSINVVLALLGGSILFLMAIIYSLVYLSNIEKGIDLLTVFLPTLPPEEAVKIIKSIYFKSKKNRWLP